MKLSDLDRNPDNGGMPISAALMLLATIVNNADSGIADNVREAGRLTLADARIAMTTEITVRQKEGGGFALDFLRVVPAVKAKPLLDDSQTGPRH